MVYSFAMAEREQIVGEMKGQCRGANGSLKNPVEPPPRIFAYIGRPPTVICDLLDKKSSKCWEGDTLCRFLVPQRNERGTENELICEIPGFDKKLIYNREVRS